MAVAQLGSGPMADRMAMERRLRIGDRLGAFSYIMGGGITSHIRSLSSYQS